MPVNVNFIIFVASTHDLKMVAIYDKRTAKGTKDTKKEEANKISAASQINGIKLKPI
ncbi:MAG: hypothetical protein HWQ35_25550 [Nostoc sp. NMS1]|uniref:hypothetical protein n=1 Tax=unclassified Nostoc TaxID=2593658 RepID=UPI0025F34F11|nr:MULTISPECIES: hypothetical protein [unclassified Nostoc]MBN3909779.1 hypothetical protein [Nostoc sp. NMS1]